MGFHVHTTRSMPLDAAAGAVEVKLCVPFPTSQGGDGWAGMKTVLDASSSATSFSISHLTVAYWTNFEATAISTTDRFNGLLIKTVQGTARILDYDGTNGNITVGPGLAGQPANGTDVWIQADFPRLISKLVFVNNDGADSIRWSAVAENIATLGPVHTLVNPLSTLTIIDDTYGTPSFNIWVLSDNLAFAADDFSFFVFTP